MNRIAEPSGAGQGRGDPVRARDQASTPSRPSCPGARLPARWSEPRAARRQGPEGQPGLSTVLDGLRVRERSMPSSAPNAEAVVASVLTFLASEPERLARFFILTGLSPD